MKKQRKQYTPEEEVAVLMVDFFNRVLEIC